jgi:hypothetical protein
MTMKDITDPYVLKPCLTADGKPWTQRCYICKKPVNFLKMSWGSQWIRDGEVVRHKKCYPPPLYE